MDTNALLTVEALSAGYGDGDVVHDAAFALHPGEFAAVLGKNGSGKSTLLKALQNLLPETRGRVRLDGDDVAALGPRELARRIAYVPQLAHPVFDFTVLDIVHMGRYARQPRLGGLTSEDDRAVREALAVTRTADLAGRRLAGLSGGERQRAFIARALAQDTPLLLLDEPSAHLDIACQVEIFRLLGALRRDRGKTIFIAEHNINLAALFSERLLLLRDGRIAADGPPAALIRREIIRDIFGADVEVRSHATAGVPEISLLPGPGGGE